MTVQGETPPELKIKKQEDQVLGSPLSTSLSCESHAEEALNVVFRFQSPKNRRPNGIPGLDRKKLKQTKVAS